MRSRSSPPVPAERSSTLRQELHALLRDGSARTARELSEELGVREREIAPHLEHLERSLKNERERLVVEPPECGACGFVFGERHRLTRPGKCPRCRATRVSAPRFRIASAGEHSKTRSQIAGPRAVRVVERTQRVFTATVASSRIA